MHNLVRPSVEILRNERRMLMLQRLRQLLRTAENSVIIGLSGTPLCDVPAEAAALLNLIKGRHHQSLTDEGFVFHGSLSAVLDTLGYKDATHAPVPLNGSLQSAKAAILRAVAESQRIPDKSKHVRELCRYVPHRAMAVVEPGMLPQWYDRAARPVGDRCLQGYQIQRGDVFSVACFNRAVVGSQELNTVQQPQQHAIGMPGLRRTPRTTPHQNRNRTRNVTGMVIATK